MSKVALSSQVSALLSSGQTSGVKTHQEKGGDTAFSQDSQSEGNAGFMSFVENYFQTPDIKGEKPTGNAEQQTTERDVAKAGGESKSALAAKSTAQISVENAWHTGGESKKTKTVLQKQDISVPVLNPLAVVQAVIPQERSGATLEKSVPPSSENYHASVLGGQTGKGNLRESLLSYNMDKTTSSFVDKSLPVSQESVGTQSTEVQNNTVPEVLTTEKNITKEPDSVIEPNLANISPPEGKQKGQNPSVSAKNDANPVINVDKSGQTKLLETSNSKVTENIVGFVSAETGPIQNLNSGAEKPFVGYGEKNTTLPPPASLARAPKENSLLSTAGMSGAPKVSAITKSSNKVSDVAMASSSLQKDVSVGNTAVSSEQGIPANFTADNSAFLMQLSQVRLLSDGTYNMSAVLTPPELGTVEAEVKISNGVLSVVITSHSLQTHNLLIQHGQEVAESLQTNPSNVSFSLQQESNHNFGDGMGQANFSDPTDNKTSDKNEEMVLHSLYLDSNSLHVVL